MTCPTSVQHTGLDHCGHGGHVIDGKEVTCGQSKMRIEGGLVRAIDGDSDRELDGPFGFDVYPVVIDDLGSFAYHLKRRALPGAGLDPISFDGAASPSSRDPTFKLNDALLAGTHPFSEVVWLTLDPVSLGNDNLYQIVRNLMHGGAGDAYRGHVAFLSDMMPSAK
jgi:hypothetical protein